MSFKISDGHVEVHLQDETESDWARIRRRLQQMGNETVRINVELHGDEEASTRIQRLNRHLSRLQRLARDRIRIEVDFDGDRVEQAMARIVLQMERMRSRARDLQRESSGMFRSFGNESQRNFHRANQASSSFFSRLTQQMSGAKGMGIALLVALPALATAAGGAITLALGGALAGLGMTFAAQSDDIRGEFRSLARDLGRDMRLISAPFKATWRDMVGTARVTFAELKPALATIFAQMAPAVSQFVRDLGRGFLEFKPAIQAWSDSFTLLLGKLGPELPTIFGNLAKGLTAVTDAVARNPEQFGNLLKDLTAMVAISGQLIGFFMDLYPTVNQFSGSLSKVVGVTGQVLPVLAELASWMLAISNPISFAMKTWDAYNDVVGAAKVSGSELGQSLANVGVTLLTTGVQAQAASGPWQALDAELNKAGDSALKLDDRLKALKNAINQLLNPSLALYNSKTQLANGMEQLRKAVQRAGGSLTTTTAATRAARTAFTAQISTTAQLGENTLAATKSMTKARAAIAEQIPFLWKMAGANKGAQAQVAALARSFGVSGSQAFTSKGKADALNAAIKRLKSKSVTINADTSPARAAVAAFINTVNSALIKIAAGMSEGGVLSFADGGENHVAQIARGGPMRMWNEPETGGEAYIPLAESKRGRSEAILEQVAERFGLMVARPLAMADGGVVSYASGGLSKRKPPTKKEKAKEKAAKKARAAEEAKETAGRGLLAGLTRAMMQSLEKVQAYANKVNEAIKKHFSGAQEKRLLTWAAGIQRAMATAATKAEAIAAKIKEAKDFAASTTASAKQFAGVSGLGTVSNARDLTSGLQFRGKQLSDFAGQIAALQKRGLSKGLMQQLIELGPGQGNNLADVLMKADPATFKKMNEAQAQIDKAAKAFGDQAADNLFDAGKGAGKGFLTGLLQQEAELNKLMDKLGKKLADGIKGAFGLLPKTPKGAKRYTAQKMADGGIAAAGQLALVGERGRELVQFGDTGGRVWPARQTEQMIGGGRGVTIQGNLIVQVTGILDLSDPGAARRFATQAAPAMTEAMRRYERQYA